MRAIRWKKGYLTGDPEVDGRNRALVAILADLSAELSRVEHCQDMNDLADRLAEITGNRLSRLSDGPDAVSGSDAAIAGLFRRDFPLAARSTPACRECGLCDLLEGRIQEWLEVGGDPPAPSNGPAAQGS